MKINVKMPRDVPFENLDYGDVFYSYSYGGTYIKIIPLEENNGDSYNAVDLRDGSLEYFDNGKVVNKLDSELNAKLELVSE